jgi:hypothetical protein
VPKGQCRCRPFCSPKMGLKCLSLREGGTFGLFVLVGHRLVAYKGGEFGRPDCPPWLAVTFGEGGFEQLIPAEGRIRCGEPLSRRIIGASGPEAAPDPSYFAAASARSSNVFSSGSSCVCLPSSRYSRAFPFSPLAAKKMP